MSNKGKSKLTEPEEHKRLRLYTDYSYNMLGGKKKPNTLHVY